MRKAEEIATEIANKWRFHLNQKEVAGFGDDIASALRQVAQEKERETLENAIAACKGVYARRKADGLLEFNAIMQCVDAIRALSPTPTEDVSTPGELIDQYQSDGYVRVPRDMDPQLAKDAAQRFRRYLSAFNGKRFDDPDQYDLAMALDHLEEASAMLLNLADRAMIQAAEKGE